MAEAIVVGIAEIKGNREPNNILIAPSLGAGIALCAYDPQARIAAMAHIALPESNNDETTPGKYADTAVPSLLERMRELGADPERVRVGLAGAAQLSSFRGAFARLDVGVRNLSAVQAALEQAGLPVIGSDLGGMEGRAVHMTADGRVYVRSAGKRDRELVNLGLAGAAPQTG